RRLAARGPEHVPGLRQGHHLHARLPDPRHHPDPRRAARRRAHPEQVHDGGPPRGHPDAAVHVRALPLHRRRQHLEQLRRLRPLQALPLGRRRRQGVPPDPRHDRPQLRLPDRLVHGLPRRHPDGGRPALALSVLARRTVAMPRPMPTIMDTLRFLPALLLVLALAAPAAAQQRIAYLDSEYVLERITEYRTAQAALDRLAQQWQNELAALRQEADALELDFEARELLYTEEERQ